jgi:AAA15 family ATPase/GTPase
MIKTLAIENFKSIKRLELDCKKINLFIGEPNAGKSNILESLGLLSHTYHGKELRGFVRFENMRDFFYDHVLDDAIRIRFDGKILETTFKDGNFTSTYTEEEGKHRVAVYMYEYNGAARRMETVRELSEFKFFRFSVRELFPNQKSDFLLPPDGDNLLAVVLSHKGLRATAKSILDPFGLRLVLEPQDNKIKVQKQLEDIFVSFPYALISETLQRLVFYLTAIQSSNNSVLAFEEPEAHAFPYYTKYLAESIAFDKNNNQYFVSTHNPYFLASILEKAPKRDVAIFVAHMKDYQTKAKLLSQKDIQDIWKRGIDAFFNIDRFLP